GGVMAAETRVTFENGNEGWNVNTFDVPETEFGNPGANLRWANFADTWWLDLQTDTHAAFLGNLSRYGNSVTLSVDVRVNFIRNFFGNPTPQKIVLELRDYDNPPNGLPYVSVFKVLGEVTGDFQDWQTFSTTIDPTSATLPAGWGGYGDEDPVTFEPRLPAGRTFANVLASVDKVLFTTAQPGYFYVSGFFDVAYDNIAISTPAPACDSIDFNQNEVFPEDQDVIDFFSVLAGAECPTGTCNDIDFNNNGVFPEDQDVIDFFTVLAGGNC
ncbi:MAG TPA: hypothetical protein VK157_04510, partial [Phycisphaerales bacterium]|nr:hypothetical protein [Phycisphaerales bacterium]